MTFQNHDPLCGLEGEVCPACRDAEFDPGMSIEGVTPPAYRTQVCKDCGVSEQASALFERRCADCHNAFLQRRAGTPDPMDDPDSGYRANEYTREEYLAAFGGEEPFEVQADDPETYAPEYLGGGRMAPTREEELEFDLDQIAAESERRRQSIAHLLAWKSEALTFLSDLALAEIDRRLETKRIIGIASPPMRPEDVPEGYGDLVSTIIWVPTYDTGTEGQRIVVCRNCQTAFETHDKATTACQETFLRSAHGDR